MKFSYLDYTREITALAVELPTNFSEAWDRFRADVSAGEARDYNTGDVLKDFDFKSAGEKWDALTEVEQQQARDEWNDFLTREIELKLVEAYKTGKE